MHYFSVIFQEPKEHDFSLWKKSSLHLHVEIFQQLDFRQPVSKAKELFSDYLKFQCHSMLTILAKWGPGQVL